MIGPEVPLVAGAADAVRAAGIACFGPSAAAARIEGSKSFAKDVMAAAGVPTAGARDLRRPRPRWTPRSTPSARRTWSRTTGWPPARASWSPRTGRRPARTPPPARGHRAWSRSILDGPEVSLFCVTDGEAVLPLLPAQDVKRVGDGDTGPNTGGMGAYAPLPWAPPGLVDDVLAASSRPTLAEMRRRGTPFAGLLYVGLALTAAGPRVVEFNARFGDPETQVVLALLETPLAGLLHAAATGTLAAHPPLRWRAGAAVTVVLAAAGYPGAAAGRRRDHRRRPARRAARRHPPPRRRRGGVRRRRVLSVVGTGDTWPPPAPPRTAGWRGVHLAGAHHRTDIALGAVEGRIEVPGTRAAARSG